MNAPLRNISDEKITQSIANILGAGVENKVRTTVDTWNQRIRDQLRKATGLRLSHGDQVQHVPIRVIPYLPRTFIDIVRNWDENFLQWVFTNLADLETTRQTLRDFYNTYPMIEQALAPDVEPAAVPTDINLVADLVDQIIEARKIDWPGVIRHPEEPSGASRGRSIEWDGSEPFGTYNPRHPSIEIHWVAIGMFVTLSDEFNNSVEDLTAKVLAHELAHAYTHVGFDIDGIRWDTDAFVHTDIFILEGLAQIYSEAVCLAVRKRNPGPLSAMNDLLIYQAPWYSEHRNWAPTHSHRSEIIRHALIDTRTKGEIEYESFLSQLDHFSSEWEDISQATVPEQSLL
jgi:hypothetical protein